MSEFPFTNIDLNRFLSDDLFQPDLIASLSRETPIHTNDLNDFLNLPLNKEYKGLMVKATEKKVVVFCEPTPETPETPETTMTEINTK